jgi:hypothetical protein
MRSRKALTDSNWVQTVIAIGGLVFTILVSLGVITPEQSAEGLPVFTNLATAISTAVASVVFLIGLFFKGGSTE